VWTEAAVYPILRNPKYTGHMVFGRTRKTPGGRIVQVPADQWLWSPEPTHPAIITRALWDAAQAIGTEHSTSRDGAAVNTHRQTRRSYILRSRVRCRSCQRRMSGITRTAARYWADGPDYSNTYYTCSHNPDDPRQTAPDTHPRTISVREDHLLPAIHDFFAQRVFGPDRATLLAADLPTTAADDQARRDRQTAALGKRLRQIDAAENAHAREIESLAHLDDPHAPAVIALRSRVLARFTELEDERTAINTQLADLAKTDSGPGDPALLDALPMLGDLLADAPARPPRSWTAAPEAGGIGRKTCRHRIDPAPPPVVADRAAVPAPPSWGRALARARPGTDLFGWP
jgi:hypothetical protein